MKRQIIAGLALTLSTLTISAPAHAKFEYRNLPVAFDCNNEWLAGSKYCPVIIKVADIKACHDAGGKVGAIGTQPVCVSATDSRSRPRVGPPPFFPEEVAAKHFVPILVPMELYNGQADPRATK